MENLEPNEIQLASTTNWFDQFRILTWKNFTLLKRRVIGFAFEVLLSVFIICMLLVSRHFVENIQFPQQKNPTYNVIDYYFNNYQEDLVLYYPDSAVARNVVERAFRFIKSEKWWYNSISSL